MSDCYVIIDLDGYVSEMRKAVGNSIADANTDDLDQYISLDQMKGLVNAWCVGYDDNDRPILDEEANQNIFEDTSVWMTNVGLAKLASQGLVECAWDNESNEMVFWIPENKPNDKSTKNKRTKRKDK